MQKAALTRVQSIEPVEFDWGRLYWYVTGEQDNSDHQTVGKCVIKPGQQNGKHCHPNCEEVLHLLSGRIEHFVEDQGWLPMEPGDTITIAANVWHHARNVGDQPAEMIICFSSADRRMISGPEPTSQPSA